MIYLLVALLLLIPSWGGASVYPPDARIVDVTQYGASPVIDSVDDTQAFRDATHVAAHYGHIMSVPCGDYIVSGRIKGEVPHGGPLKGVGNWTVQGEGSGCVTLRLADNAPGYSSPSSPESIFYTCSYTNGDAPSTLDSCGGVRGFVNSISGMTIDLGSGNPGSIGIDYLANNRGSIFDVKIRGSGGCRAGILVQRSWGGPAQIRDVEVEGCQYGILFGGTQYSTVIQDVVLSGQTVASIAGSSVGLAIERLKTDAPVTSVSRGNGNVVILDSEFSGSSPSNYAVTLADTGSALLRDVTAVGYAGVVKFGTQSVPGNSVTEWASSTSTLSAESAQTLRIAEPPTPDPFYTSDFSQWANVISYGANPGDFTDDTAAIQAAMDSGKPIVYMPTVAPGSAKFTYYDLSGPILIPCSVRRIYMMESKFREHSSGFGPGEDIWVMDSGCSSSDELTIQNGWTQIALEPGAYVVRHEDARKLYLRDVTFGGNEFGYRSGPEAGPVWGDNVYFKTVHIENEAYFRQLNTENQYDTGNVVDGGLLRVLGHKTEFSSFSGNETLACVNGSRCEILGGFYMPCIGHGSTPPDLGFRIEDSDFSASYETHCFKDPVSLTTWATHVSETVGGSTQSLAYTDLPTVPAEGGHKVTNALFSVMAAMGGGSAPGVIYMVARETPAAPLDVAMKARLESRGYSVTQVGSASATAAEAAAVSADAIVITGSTGDLDPGFASTSIPIVMMEPYRLNALGLVRANIYGYHTGVSSVSIVDESHPGAADLSGSQAIYSSPNQIAWGRVEPEDGNEGVVVAHSEAGSQYHSVIAWSSGAGMYQGVPAPGKRAFLPFFENATDLSSAGWSLFDAVVEWAAGAASNPESLCVEGSESENRYAISGGGFVELCRSSP